MAKKNDIQRNKYFLTINSPDHYGYSHEKIKEISSGFKTFQYAAVVDEKGSNLHTHVLLVFESRVRWSTIQDRFPHAHIDEGKGDISQIIQYMRKEGKWLLDEKKQEQKIEGSFEDWGTRPADTKEKVSEFSELYDLVYDEIPTGEILKLNPKYIRYIDKIAPMRIEIMNEKYRGKRRLDLKVIYVFGLSGTGKTRMILDRHGEENVFRVTDYLHPFDSYNMQQVMCLEEFRDSLTITQCLNLLDVYTVELPARYANKLGIYKVLYVVSNWNIEQQFKNVQVEHKETYRAFRRRFHYILNFQYSGVFAWSNKDYAMGFPARMQVMCEFTQKDIAEKDWQHLVDLMSVETMQKIVNDELNEQEVFEQIAKAVNEMEKPETFEGTIADRKKWINKCKEGKRDIRLHIFHSYISDLENSNVMSPNSMGTSVIPESSGKDISHISE